MAGGYVLEARDELPPARTRKTQVYRDSVARFLDNPDLLAVRVELEGKGPDAAYVGLRTAVRDFGAEGTVRVSRRGGHLWLVRIG